MPVPYGGLPFSSPGGLPFPPPGQSLASLSRQAQARPHHHHGMAQSSMSHFNNGYYAVQGQQEFINTPPHHYNYGAHVNPIAIPNPNPVANNPSTSSPVSANATSMSSSVTDSEQFRKLARECPAAADRFVEALRNNTNISIGDDSMTALTDGINGLEIEEVDHIPVLDPPPPLTPEDFFQDPDAAAATGHDHPDPLAINMIKYPADKKDLSMLIQILPAQIQNTKEHTPGREIHPEIHLGAMKVAHVVASFFKGVYKTRMHSQPHRPGRQVLMFELIFDQPQSYQAAREWYRARCSDDDTVNGMSHTKFPRYLFAGFDIPVEYRIMAADFWTGIIIPEHSTTNDYAVIAFRRRWLGCALFTRIVYDIDENDFEWARFPYAVRSNINRPNVNYRSINHPFLRRTNARNFNHQNPAPELEVCMHSILQGFDVRTSVMIKNIENHVTNKEFFADIIWATGGTFDYAYLRMNFNTGTNVGYGFVNFMDAVSILPLVYFLGFHQWGKAVPELSYANFQGLETLVSRFRNSAVMDSGWGFRPHLFRSVQAAGHMPLDLLKDSTDEGAINRYLANNEIPFPGINNEMKHRNSQANVGTGIYPPSSRRNSGPSGFGSGFRSYM